MHPGKLLSVCIKLFSELKQVLYFLCRDSEAIIPSIFFFLVLLSYERYHSKQIISIPKIIQLCDGIMASGRKAVTHGESSKEENAPCSSVFPIN